MPKLSDFSYNLPKELIAQRPAKDRASSRLLVIDRATKKIYDRNFSDILDYLKEGDCLVLNNTKVKPYRLVGKKADTNGRVDVLLMDRLGTSIYKCLIRANHALKDRTKIIFNKGLSGKFCKGDNGFSLMEFDNNAEEMVKRIGLIPLPPYIKRQPDREDKFRYQTIYAKIPGAIASPTAGLHFTREMLDKISSEKVDIAYVTLHINYATFKAVEVTDITKHNMHTEYFILTRKTADIINSAKARGGRIIAVGTSSARVLETAAEEVKTGQTKLKEVSGLTDLFIYPPYKFKMVDMLLTNFHMPNTTLLMLVSAFMVKKTGSRVKGQELKGIDLMMKAYKHAIIEKYRFLSYGDVMLVI